MLLLNKKFVIGFFIIVLAAALASVTTTSPSLSGVPVLNYHQINNEAHNVLTLSSQEFDAQMNYLSKSGYSTISPEQLADFLETGRALPPNPILITFDDGYEDNYRVAYPILQKYNFTATFFIITDFAGASGRYMSWKQIEEMKSKGFTFESHTVNHVALPTLADDDIRTELVKSKEVLEQRLHQKVEYLAYPGGLYDQRVISLVKEAGYRAAFTVNLGRDLEYCGLFTLNRIPIFSGPHSFLHFRLRLKFTEAAIELQKIRNAFSNSSISRLANWIFVS